MSSLGENASFIMGQAPASSACNTNGVGTPFVKAGQFGESIPIIDEWTTNPLKMARESDVLICVVGATSGKLNRGIDCAIGRSVAAIRPRENVIRDYIYYGLHPWIQRLRNGSQGSAIGVITKDMLESVELPFPNVERQQRIVQCLSLIESVIRNRTDELLKLDNLIKARFVEMFGDPKSNPHCFEKRELRSTCTVITGNTPSRAISAYYGNYIEWIKTDNIVAGKTTPSKAAEYLSKRGMSVGRTVDSGAILMACIAGSIASIGRVCITDRKVAFNQQINAIVPNDYDVRFLYVLLQISKDYLVEEINMALKGILSKSKLEDKEFYVPPIEQQMQFAEFVEQVDKSKAVVQKSLDEAQLLFDSLMHMYFG